MSSEQAFAVLLHPGKISWPSTRMEKSTGSSSAPWTMSILRVWLLTSLRLSSCMQCTTKKKNVIEKQIIELHESFKAHHEVAVGFTPHGTAMLLAVLTSFLSKKEKKENCQRSLFVFASWCSQRPLAPLTLNMCLKNLFCKTAALPLTGQHGPMWRYAYFKLTYEQ